MTDRVNQPVEEFNLQVGETYQIADLIAAFPGAIFIGFEDDEILDAEEEPDSTCESCDRIATRMVFNGMHHLPVCEWCWREPDCILMEALYEFNFVLLGDERTRGTKYEQLHNFMDPNELLDRYVTDELERRGMRLKGQTYLDLLNRATDLYNEWYAQ